MTTGQLVRYDAMCRAIDAAYEVDEVKDIRDKAFAIEAYARQAKNTEAERRACEIRLRAERKAGQLLAKMEKAKGAQYGGRRGIDGKRAQPSNQAPTLSRFGVSKDQSAKWQQLAAVPEAQFEAALTAPKKPSTSGLISKPKQDPMDPDALWLWGRLRDFENKGILDRRFDDVLEQMTKAMRDDVTRLASCVGRWLQGKE